MLLYFGPIFSYDAVFQAPLHSLGLLIVSELVACFLLRAAKRGGSGAQGDSCSEARGSRGTVKLLNKVISRRMQVLIPPSDKVAWVNICHV